MTDRKFTDDEIIKALECCVRNDNTGCKECPINPNHGNYGYCTNLALTHALALINRQKVEIESLKIANEKMYSANKEQEAEIESLNAIHADMTESLRLAAEANKDMQAEINKLKGSRNRWKQIATDFDKASRETEKEIERLYKEIERISKMTVETNVKEMTEGNHESQST
jgi:chromosome segregation ATPase